MSVSNYCRDIRIYDEYGIHVVGYLVSIEDAGLVMLSEIDFSSDREFSLMLEDITQLEPGHKALFSATCDKCIPESGCLESYRAHLNFTHLSKQAATLTHLLH